MFDPKVPLPRQLMAIETSGWARETKHLLARGVLTGGLVETEPYLLKGAEGTGTTQTLHLSLPLGTEETLLRPNTTDNPHPTPGNKSEAKG